MARLLTVMGTPALVAALFAGCGGSDDRAKVESSLRAYLGSLIPEETAFPIGAGAPRVTTNSCKDRHAKTRLVLRPRGLNDPSPQSSARFRDELALWSCVVSFARVAMPVLVAVDDSAEVVWATPNGGPALPPARTYTSN